MFKAGITGGIGSGKTTVCDVFELLGIPVYYSDSRAKLLMSEDQDLIAVIRREFGPETYTEKGELNRSYLGSVVFNDASRLAVLNSVVHPAVFRDFDRWAAKQNAPYVLKETAILFESGSDKDCDATIFVSSPAELRISRVMNRDKVTAEAVKKRMDKQMPEEEKEKLADYKLINNERQLLIPQIIELHAALLKRISS